MPSLSSLDPRFGPAAQWFYERIRRLHPFVITSAKRSSDEQARLWRDYQDWLMSPHRQAADPYHLPALPPGRSMHERGFAFDMASANGADPKLDGALAAAGTIWRRLGGRWAGPSDPVHFEAPGSMTGRRS